MSPSIQIPVITAAIVTVILLVKFKKLINRFRDSGTISPRTAKALEDLNIFPRRMFYRLLRWGIINEAGSAKFYLNERNLEEYYQLRRIRIIIIFGILIILILVDLLI